jgi:uncharacterized protein DUF6152
MTMTRKYLGALAVMVLAIFSAAPLLAHHSVTAEFDSTKPFTVKATITKIEWVNPHVYVYADVKDDNGTVTPYSFEGGPPGNLRRAGVLKTMFNVGDIVEIESYTAKDGSKHLGLLHAVRFADGHQILFGRAEDSEGKN